MSDPTSPDHEPVAPDLEIALADFLPDGVTVDGDAAPVAAEAPTADDEIDLALLDAVEHDLGAVDAALAALDDGSYGTCVVCRTPIPADDLAADPVRRTCPQHA